MESPVRGRGVFFRLPENIIGGLLRGTGRRDEQARIRLESVNPALEIRYGIADCGLFDACRTAKHRAAHFRHEFLLGIILRAERLYFLNALASESLSVAR
jgi:hypothetical protein